MLYSGVIVGIICFFLNSYYSGKLLGYSSWMQIKDIAPSYGIATIIALSVYFLKLLPISYWLVFSMQLVISVVECYVLCEIMHLEEFLNIRSIVNLYYKKML